MAISDIKSHLVGIVISVVALILIVLFNLKLAGAMAGDRVNAAEQKVAAALQKAEDLRKERDTAKAEAAGWKAKSDALEPALADAQRRLANMKPLPPASNPASAPTGTADLAVAFASEGFPPQVQNDNLAWAASEARPMLPLIRDGKHYKDALERIENLEEQTGILTTQKEDLTQSYAALQTAETACEGQVAALHDAVDEQKKVIAGKDTQIRSEKAKGWLKGGLGVVIGYAIKAILVAL